MLPSQTKEKRFNLLYKVQPHPDMHLIYSHMIETFSCQSILYAGDKSLNCFMQHNIIY